MKLLLSHIERVNSKVTDDALVRPDLRFRVFIWLGGFLRVLPTRLAMALGRRIGCDVRSYWEVSRLYAGESALPEAETNTLIARVHHYYRRRRKGFGVDEAFAMEAAFRLFNLALLMERTEDASVMKFMRLERSNAIEKIPAESGNNHLLVSLAAVVVSSVMLKEEVEPWSGWFLREVRRQFHENGENFEASSAYHMLSTEAAVLAYAAISQEGIVDRGVEVRLSRAVGRARQLIVSGELFPNFGDSDGGSIFFNINDTFVRRRGIVDSLAEICAPAAPQREANYLRFLEGERWKVAVRVGGVGQNGKGGHSHNDYGAVWGALDGLPILIESGTHFYAFGRVRYRSAAAHSVVYQIGLEPGDIVTDRFSLRRAGEFLDQLRSNGDVVTKVVSSTLEWSRVTSLSDDALTVADSVYPVGQSARSSFIIDPRWSMERISEREILLILGVVEVRVACSMPILQDRVPIYRTYGSRRQWAMRLYVEIPAGQRAEAFWEFE